MGTTVEDRAALRPGRTYEQSPGARRRSGAQADEAAR